MEFEETNHRVRDIVESIICEENDDFQLIKNQFAEITTSDAMSKVNERDGSYKYFDQSFKDIITSIKDVAETPIENKEIANIPIFSSKKQLKNKHQLSSQASNHENTKEDNTAKIASGEENLNLSEKILLNDDTIRKKLQEIQLSTKITVKENSQSIENKILCLIDVAINPCKYKIKSIANNNRKLFWEDASNSPKVIRILNDSKPETLRRYWGIIKKLSSIDNFISLLARKVRDKKADFRNMK